MPISRNILIGLFLVNLLPFFAFADEPTPDPCPNAGTYGCFEVGLPGITDKSIDNFIKDDKPIIKFINLAVRVVIAILVIIGVISIVIGGYMYMTAGGDGGRVKMAKEMIVAALVGILLSLISVVILNTINKYLGSEAVEPELGNTGAGAGGTPGSGANLTPAEEQQIQNSLPKNGGGAAGPLPESPSHPDALLPTNNTEALNVTTKNIDDLDAATNKIPPNSTVDKNTWNTLVKQSTDAQEQIQQLELRNVSSQQVNGLKQRYQTIRNRLGTLRFAP